MASLEAPKQVSQAPDGEGVAPCVPGSFATILWFKALQIKLKLAELERQRATALTNLDVQKKTAEMRHNRYKDLVRATGTVRESGEAFDPLKS